MGTTEMGGMGGYKLSEANCLWLMVLGPWGCNLDGFYMMTMMKMFINPGQRVKK